MTETYSDLHATAAMQTIRAAEAAVLAPELGGLAGGHGLYICVGTHMELPRTPMLGVWAHLVLGDDTLFDGSVHARSDEPLPFNDDVFRVVVLSHALEWTPHAAQLLSEVTRVLAPNGLIAITGFRPLAAWWPWLIWRARGCELGFSVIAPTWLRPGLMRRDIEVYATRRFGPAWPTSTGGSVSRVGGCYLMLGRKRRQALTPLRLREMQSRSRAHSPLATGAQRECA